MRPIAEGAVLSCTPNDIATNVPIEVILAQKRVLMRALKLHKYVHSFNPER